MPATNQTLPVGYFEGELEWWITSIPPYYCYSANPGGSDFSSDDIWLGVSSAIDYISPIVLKTTGLKYAYTNNIGSGFPVAAIKFVNGAGTPTGLAPLNKIGGLYNPFSLQDTYDVGSSKIPLAFGPYPISKTNPSLPYPTDDGDIILITTGSDVLAGSINDGGTALGAGDNRMWNLLLYSTGSNDVTRLSAGVNSTSADILINYDGNTRNTYIQNSGGVFGFVAIPNSGDPSQLMWWPLSYSFNDNTIIVSRNDS
jgi:hypothetical protein